MATWLLLLSPPQSVVPAHPLLEGLAESSFHVDGPLSGSQHPRAQHCGRGDGESPGPASAQHPEPGGGAQPRPGLPGRHSWALPMCPGPSGGLLSVTLPGGHHVPGPDRSGPAGQLLHHQPQEAEEGMGVDVRGNEEVPRGMACRPQVGGAPAGRGLAGGGPGPLPHLPGRLCQRSAQTAPAAPSPPGREAASLPAHNARGGGFSLGTGWGGAWGRGPG